VAGFGAVLAPPPAGRPSQPVWDICDRFDDQGAEQGGDLVAGERDLTGGRRAGVLDGGGDGEESQGEHGQGGPPVPGVPAADLMLIQPGQSFAGLEILFSQPPVMPPKLCNFPVWRLERGRY